MKTGLITSDTYQDHNTGQGHPEQIARVSVIIENFKKKDIANNEVLNTNISLKNSNNIFKFY